MRNTLSLLVVAGFFTAGCGPSDSRGTGGDGGGSIAGLMSIDVMPSAAALTIAGGQPASQQFSALGHFVDGHTEDVTGRVSWALTDVSVGTLDGGGAFTSVTLHGGHSLVQASDGTHQGAANLTVKLVTSRVSTDDGSTAPADSATHFAGAAEDPTLVPALAYPLDGAHVPHNLGLLEVQWRKPSAPADLFEVSFESDTIDFKLYTNKLLPAGGRLSLTPGDWQSVADSVKGGKVQVLVRGALAAAPGKMGSSAAASLVIGASDVEGGIYYFAPVSSTGAAVGAVVRHAFGDTSGMPKPYYAPNNATRCVGCHVLTRDGTRMAVTYDGGNGVAAGLNVADLSSLLPEGKGLALELRRLLSRRQSHGRHQHGRPPGLRLVGRRRHRHAAAAPGAGRVRHPCLPMASRSST